MFVEAYPQFKKLSADVSKHVTLLGEINRLVEAEGLMELSQAQRQQRPRTAPTVGPHRLLPSPPPDPPLAGRAGAGVHAGPRIGALRGATTLARQPRPTGHPQSAPPPPLTPRPSLSL